jgi:uncharacterized membrane protein YjfL (UPF0719 family)
MYWRKWSLAGLLVVGGLAFWLMLAGPDRLLGIESGNLGVAIVMLVGWGSFLGISTAPRGELEETVSPGEWQAWVGLGFTALIAAYFFAKASLFAGATDLRDVQAVARNLVLLVITWAIVSGLLRSRWKGRVLADERDRDIETLAAGWGRGALVAVVIGIALMLTFSPAEKLRWATPIAIANLLVFALIWSCLVEYAITAFNYRRDRR